MVTDWLTANCEIVIQIPYLHANLIPRWPWLAIESSTESRHNIEYKKIMFEVMTSCCGNTNTKCGNTTKTIWPAFGRIFRFKGNSF